jgi:acetyl esterase/lipase
MKRRVEALRRSGTEVEYHRYENLGHGFGLGTGTSAEGWVFEAIRFWQTSIRRLPSRPRR